MAVEMELKLNEPQLGIPLLSLTYTGLESEFAVERIEKRVIEPGFVIIIFAPKPSLLWKKLKGWIASLFRRST